MPYRGTRLGDTETGRNGDPVTESPSHPVTVSYSAVGRTPQSLDKPSQFLSAPFNMHREKIR
jgi:hypothetical protein